MSSEISISAFLSFVKGSLVDELSFALTRFNMSGVNWIHRTQLIASTDTTLDVAALTTPGLAIFVNRGPSTVVQLKNAAAGTIFPLLKVGEPALLRFDTSVVAPVAIATARVISAITNTAAAKMTSAGHGLPNPSSTVKVIITGFTAGWASANGTWTPTYVDANNFTIPVDSTGFGAISGSPVFVSSSLEYLLLED